MSRKAALFKERGDLIGNSKHICIIFVLRDVKVARHGVGYFYFGSKLTIVLDGHVYNLTFK
jgi:hypothetical protein